MSRYCTTGLRLCCKELWFTFYILRQSTAPEKKTKTRLVYVTAAKVEIDRSKIEMLWSLYSIHPLVIFQKSCKWLSEIILNGQLIKYSTHQSNHLNRWNTYYINNVFKCMSTVCDRKRCVSKTSHPAWTSWIVWADTEQFEQIRKAIFSLLNTEIYSM